MLVPGTVFCNIYYILHLFDVSLPIIFVDLKCSLFKFRGFGIAQHPEHSGKIVDGTNDEL